jgi:pimeloyl-ACP methyl ester carboxylesterase
LTALQRFEPVYFQLRHLQLAGWRSGPVNAPLCLCLHGWQDNANSFAALAPYLTDVQLLAIDLPGHGQSGHRSAGAHYHFADWLDELCELFQLMQQPTATVHTKLPIHLIGHSMGGMIGTMLAATFPEYIRSLILLDSFGLVTAEADNTTRQLRQALLSRQKLPPNRRLGYPDLPAAARARQHQSDFDFASALLLAERGTVQREQSWYWTVDLRLRLTSAYRWDLAQARQIISDVQAPVLALLATDGLEMIKQARLTFESAYQQLELIEMPGGHHLQLTQPAAVAARIQAFLRVHECRNTDNSAAAGSLKEH